MTKSTNPIVWVLQEGNNDYAPAEKFGEVRFVTHADLRNVASSAVNTNAMVDIDGFLEQFDPQKDFVVPVGNPMIIAFVSYKLLSAFPLVRYLKWDGRQADYFVFNLSREGVV